MKTKAMVLNAINKLKFALLAMLALGMSVSVSSCTEEDSADLPDNVSIFQRYMVCFSDAHPTLAYARFSKEKDVALKEIKLTGSQGIKANQKNMEYHYMDNNARLDYSYFQKLNNDTTVSFVFYRKATKVLVNYAYKKDIKPIHIPTDLKEISNDKDVKWVGDALAADEMLEVSLNNTSKKEGHVLYYGSANANMNGFVFSNVPAGTYELTLRRCRKLTTQQNDGSAKGEILVTYYDKKTVTVK